MSWERGRDRVEELLAAGELEVVTASETLGRRLVDDARRHLASAECIAADDPAGAYQLAYDAARKAASALLATQGLRATSRGGHIAVQDTVRHQFGGPGGTTAFDALPRMRRQRAALEYPGPASPTITSDDTTDALTTAGAILTTVTQLLDSGRLSTFEPR